MSTHENNHVTMCYFPLSMLMMSAMVIGRVSNCPRIYELSVYYYVWHVVCTWLFALLAFLCGVLARLHLSLVFVFILTHK